MSASESALTNESSWLTSTRNLSVQLTIFIVGLAAMIVSGWYLIEGMLHFAGDESSKKVFIAAGIIFQITESICFITATAFVSRSWYWRGSLFTLGTILFMFSIGVMTLAQKATLQAGDNQATALDSRITALQAQVDSLDEVIAGYRLNAEKQSKSVFANSRELGQDSLNRAAELESKKLALTERLFELQNQRRQTSADFFKQLEKVIGLPALQTEFYFLMTRSVLLELCGIVLMAFAAHLRAPRTVAKASTPLAPIRSKLARQPTFESTSHDETGEHWARSHIRLLKQQQQGGNQNQ
jgi:hypothetical protein